MIEDHADIIEQDLEALFEAELSAAKTGDSTDWNVARYYGAPSREALAGFLYNKLQAGVPSVFVGVENTNYEIMDTVGYVAKIEVRVKVIVAANIIKDKELQAPSRFVNFMAQQVHNALIGHTVSIEGASWHYLPASARPLFRVENFDSKEIEFLIASPVMEYA